MNAWLCRFIVSSLSVFGATDGASAEAVTRAMITVDVESKEGIPLPQQRSAVCQDDIPCGLQEIVGILKEYGVAATFFLNVYEYRKWGEETLRGIAADLDSAGQDVALHTHPQWMYDPNRWAMFQYDVDEQTQIIADGSRLLKQWTGLPVVAHRAGAYAANADTLEALVRNGIRVDSSLFWGHQWSHLTGLGLARNVHSVWGPLTEVPVTVYERNDRPPGLSRFVPAVTSIRKIDPDWLINKQEATGAIDAVVSADLPSLVVFLHSFSFIERVSTTGSLVANRHSIVLFRKILQYIEEKQVPWVTMRVLAESGEMAIKPPAKDIVPQVPVQVGVDRYLWSWAKKLGAMLKVREAIVALTMLAVIIGLSVGWRRRRKRSQ